MADYSSAIALAKRLIEKKGQLVTLRTLASAAPPDTSKPWLPGENVPSDTTVYAVWLNYGLFESAQAKLVDAELFKTGDQKVLMPATNAAGAAILPAPGGMVIRGAETWYIILVKPLDPAGDAVMFELQVRR